jgi:hypothetical protein
LKILNDPFINLTYCLNVHPGETWPENFESIIKYVLPIKKNIATERPFGLGLRLSNEAATHFSNKALLDHFRSFLRENDLYVFTINGFPFGRFHGISIKEDVYAPDWRTQERLRYTHKLVDILAGLMPAGISASISTVPLSYKNWIKKDDDYVQMISNLSRAAIF